MRKEEKVNVCYIVKLAMTGLSGRRVKAIEGKKNDYKMSGGDNYKREYGRGK